MRFGEIENLYARCGTARPNLCFAGHTDVVPVGDAAAWSQGAFEAQIGDGVLIGRGAVDMKGAIAAFVAACRGPSPPGSVSGSLSFLITGDEEGPATRRHQDGGRGPAAEGEVIDHCVRGRTDLRRPRSATWSRSAAAARSTPGSRSRACQGHVAYPQRAANPDPGADRAARRGCKARVLDDGYPEFQPSNLEVTTVDVGNTATNVIPASGDGRGSTSASTRPTRAQSLPLDRGRGCHGRRGLAGRVDAAALDQRRGLPHRARPVRRRWWPRPCRRRRPRARAFHHRRHLRRPLHPRALPGGRVRPGRNAPCTPSTNACPWRSWWVSRPSISASSRGTSKSARLNRSPLIPAKAGTQAF